MWTSGKLFLDRKGCQVAQLTDKDAASRARTLLCLSVISWSKDGWLEGSLLEGAEMAAK
jgi:hypothetical protein